MALVTGPLHSFEAHGALGDTLIYEEWKGRYYVKPYKIPTLRRYPAQRAIRAIIRFLTDEWENTLTTEKATWEALAIAKRNTAIAEFCRYNFNRLWSGRGATKSYPAAEAETYGTVQNYNAIGGVGTVDVSGRWGSGLVGWAMPWYSLPAAGTPTPQQIVSIHKPGIYPTYNHFDVENVEPGEYCYYNCNFSIDGKMKPTFGVKIDVTVT